MEAGCTSITLVKPVRLQNTPADSRLLTICVKTGNLTISSISYRFLHLAFNSTSSQIFLIGYKSYFETKLLKDGSFIMNVRKYMGLDFSRTAPNNLNLDGEYY
jgi:hypothetical protein